jgi:hypothetical protein
VIITAPSIQRRSAAPIDAALALPYIAKLVQLTEDLQMKSKLTANTSIQFLILLFVSAVLLSCSHFHNTENVARIGPEEARAAVVGNEALLVCAYDDEACKDVLLEGAMLRSEFESKLASLPMNQTIIFYCG